jgi:hypothetical protein
MPQIEIIRRTRYMRGLLLASLTASLLCWGAPVRAGGWQVWGPEYNIPATADTAARSGDALVAKWWPDLPFRLIYWIRQSMTRPGSVPDTDTSRPMMSDRHLRGSLSEPEVRTCYWHLALADTFHALARLAKTPAGQAAMLNLAQVVEAQTPDYCRGPSGGSAAAAYGAEPVRYADLFGPGIYERVEARASMAALRRVVDEPALLRATLRARSPGLPERLSPQVLHSLPGGPPPTRPGAAIMFVVAAAAVAVGAAIPLPEEAVTWPLLAPYLAQ